MLMVSFRVVHFADSSDLCDHVTCSSTSRPPVLFPVETTCCCTRARVRVTSIITLILTWKRRCGEHTRCKVTTFSRKRDDGSH